MTDRSTWSRTKFLHPLGGHRRDVRWGWAVGACEPTALGGWHGLALAARIRNGLFPSPSGESLTRGSDGLTRRTCCSSPGARINEGLQSSLEGLSAAVLAGSPGIGTVLRTELVRAQGQRLTSSGGGVSGSRRRHPSAPTTAASGAQERAASPGRTCPDMKCRHWQPTAEEAAHALDPRARAARYQGPWSPRPGAGDRHRRERCGQEGPQRRARAGIETRRAVTSGLLAQAGPARLRCPPRLGPPARRARCRAYRRRRLEGRPTPIAWLRQTLIQVA